MWAPSTSASVRISLNLVVLEHPGEAGLLDIDDLAPDGQDRLELTVAGLLCGATRRIALDDEYL